MSDTSERERFMRMALEEARKAAREGNVGVGSVIVRDGAEVARGRNLVPTTGDPTAHAETVALREAAAALGTDDFRGCTLYTTFEPCPMCCGAIMVAGISSLVMGGRPRADKTRWGGYRPERLLKMSGWNDRLRVTTGVLVEDCEEIHRA